MDRGQHLVCGPIRCQGRPVDRESGQPGKNPSGSRHVCWPTRSPHTEFHLAFLSRRKNDPSELTHEGDLNYGYGTNLDQCHRRRSKTSTTVVYDNCIEREQVYTGSPCRGVPRRKTTSRAFVVRLFYFGFAVLLYNMWLLVDLLAQISLDIEHRHDPRVTSKRFLNLARTPRRTRVADPAPGSPGGRVASLLLAVAFGYVPVPQR